MHVVKSQPPRLHLTPADQGMRLSLAEFLHADSQGGFRYELIDGKLEVSPQPNLPHNLLAFSLAAELRDYARQTPEAIKQVVCPARLIVPDRPGATAPEPDIAAYRDFPQDVPLGQISWEDLSPILVVEFLSPDSEAKDRVRNLALYLQVPSIREYWILDPLTDAERPSLTVYRRRGRRWQRPIHVAGDGTYTTPLLPKGLRNRRRNFYVAGGGTYTTPLLPGFTLVLDRRGRI